MELIQGGFHLAENFGPEHVDAFIVVLLVIFLCGCAWKWHRDGSKKEDEHRQKLELMEEEKNKDQKEANQYLREASDRQAKLMNTTLDTVKALNGTIITLNQTFEKVSDMMSGHDQRSRDMMVEISDIRNSMPTKDSLLRIGNTIDDVQRNGTSKKDVQYIMDAISSIDKKVSKANDTLSEIKARQLIS